MTIRDWISVVLLLAGAFFYFAGTVGLLRFPDVYTRLHVVTKADNVGLGFIVAALVVGADSFADVLKPVAIWLMAILGGATNGHLVAYTAWRDGVRPWRKQ